MAYIIASLNLKMPHSYILKSEVLEVRTPQIIWIFRKIIVRERETTNFALLNFSQGAKADKMCQSVVENAITIL